MQTPQLSHSSYTASLLPRASCVFQGIFFSLISKNTQLWMKYHQTIPPTMHHLLTPGSMFPYFLMKKWYTATKFKTIFKFQWFQHLHRWFFQHSGLFILWGQCLQLTCTPLISATHSKFQIWIITKCLQLLPHSNFNNPIFWQPPLSLQLASAKAQLHLSFDATMHGFSHLFPVLHT